MVKPILSPRQVAGIHTQIRRAYGAAADLQDPIPVITIARRNPLTGSFEDLAPVQLISISFAARDEQSQGENAGMVSNDAPGELRGWAPLDVQRDDRFIWQGQPCRVTTVYPVRFGVIRAAIELVQ